MTSRTDFTDAEWERLGRAPLVAGMAISLADPGGPIEALKETSAALRTVVDAAQSGNHGALRAGRRGRRDGQDPAPQEPDG